MEGPIVAYCLVVALTVGPVHVVEDVLQVMQKPLRVLKPHPSTYVLKRRPAASDRIPLPLLLLDGWYEQNYIIPAHNSVVNEASPPGGLPELKAVVSLLRVATARVVLGGQGGYRFYTRPYVPVEAAQAAVAAFGFQQRCTYSPLA